MVAVVGHCLVGVSTVKVTVRLAGSCRRVGGVEGHLEQRVGFAGVLVGNEHTIHIPVQHHDTPICTPYSHIHTRSHLGLLHTTPQKRHYS